MILKELRLIPHIIEGKNPKNLGIQNLYANKLCSSVHTKELWMESASWIVAVLNELGVEYVLIKYLDLPYAYMQDIDLLVEKNEDRQAIFYALKERGFTAYRSLLTPHPEKIELEKNSGGKVENPETVKDKGFWAGAKAYLADPGARKMTISNMILAAGAIPISMMLLFVYNKFSASAAVGGMLFVVYSLVHFATSYPAGDIADRLGGKKTQLLAVGFLIAAFVSLLLAPSAVWCAVAFVLYAGFDSLWLVNRRAVMSILAPEGRRGQYMGTFSTFYGLSSMLSPVSDRRIIDCLCMSATIILPSGMIAISKG